MKKIVLFLLSNITPAIISMEQAHNKPKQTPITAVSLRNDDLNRYVTAIETNKIVYANRLLKICRINRNEALLYAYQHNKQQVVAFLLPQVSDTTATLTYLIKTNQFKKAYTIMEKVPHTINYLYQPHNGQSLLDIIIDKEHIPLICACINYSSSNTVRHLARALVNKLCSLTNHENPLP